jgi:hypothetical protein
MFLKLTRVPDPMPDAQTFVTAQMSAMAGLRHFASGV